jgi:hypothetical protein
MVIAGPQTAVQDQEHDQGRVEPLAANRTGNVSAAHAAGSGHRAKNVRAAVHCAVFPRHPWLLLERG